jgi:hypothetical protein
MNRLGSCVLGSTPLVGFSGEAIRNTQYAILSAKLHGALLIAGTGLSDPHLTSKHSPHNNPGSRTNKDPFQKLTCTVFMTPCYVGVMNLTISY